MQLTTDGHKPYLAAVEDAFGADIDYATLTKLYGADPAEERRYSPPVCLGCETKVVVGSPDPKHISTSYVERQNLTMRMSMRRFTRLTNGFSKKIENHIAAVTLHFMHYNFARIHKTLRVTYFLISGVAFRQYRIWTRDQLLQAERVSLKEKKDWHSTKNPTQRIRYVNEVLEIDSLRGCVFHSVYRDNDKQYWDCTVDALLRAIQRYGDDRHNIIVHQGFAYAARKKLETALERAGRSFEIQPGNQNKRAEIRLADMVKLVLRTVVVKFE